MYEILSGFIQYPLGGTFENQPRWFIILLNIANSERSRLIKAKIEHNKTRTVVRKN